MALVRYDGQQLSGNLEDKLPDGPTFCGARGPGNVYGCTMNEHDPEQFPHMAGTGTDIVAIWWEGEQ